MIAKPHYTSDRSSYEYFLFPKYQKLALWSLIKNCWERSTGSDESGEDSFNWNLSAIESIF